VAGSTMGDSLLLAFDSASQCLSSSWHKVPASELRSTPVSPFHVPRAPPLTTSQWIIPPARTTTPWRHCSTPHRPTQPPSCSNCKCPCLLILLLLWICLQVGQSHKTMLFFLLLLFEPMGTQRISSGNWSTCHN
jgi:hypothetical protein